MPVFDRAPTNQELLDMLDLPCECRGHEEVFPLLREALLNDSYEHMTPVMLPAGPAMLIYDPEAQSDWLDEGVRYLVVFHIHGMYAKSVTVHSPWEGERYMDSYQITSAGSCLY